MPTQAGGEIDVVKWLAIVSAAFLGARDFLKFVHEYRKSRRRGTVAMIAAEGTVADLNMTLRDIWTAINRGNSRLDTHSNYMQALSQRINGIEQRIGD